MTDAHTCPPEGSGPRGAKAELICPECGRRGSLDGDWTVTERCVDDARHVEYVCPDCGATLVVQPVYEGTERRHLAA